MVKLTFYIAPKLNNRYSDVYDNDKEFWKGQDTPFIKYLNNCPKNHTLLDNFYITENGTFNISTSQLAAGSAYYNFTEFNYMKLEDVDDARFTRYYFINDISQMNSLYVVNYEVDIWHTFSEKMDITHGVLERALIGLDNKKHALPVAYETNEPLKFANDHSKLFYIAVEMSYYVLSKEGQAGTQRQNVTGFIGCEEEEVVGFHDVLNDRVIGRPELATANHKKAFTRDEAIKIINQLTAYQGVVSKPKGQTYANLGVPVDIYGKWIPVNYVSLMYYDRYENPLDIPPLDKTVYELTQVYAVPADCVEFNGKSDAGEKLEFGVSILTEAFRVGDPDRTEKYHWSNIALYKLDESKPEVGTIEKTLKANPLMTGYGFKDMFIPAPYNGLDTKVQFHTYINDTGFSLIMSNAQNQVTNVSKLFEIPLPFTTPNGQERQLNSMAKSMAKWQTAIGVATAAVGIAAPVLGRGLRIAKGAVNYLNRAEADFDEGPGTWYDDISIGLEGARQYRLDHPSGRTPGTTLLAGMGSALSIAQGVNQINSPISSGKANNSEPNAIINASFGFGAYIIVPNNAPEVNDTISRIGYTVYMPSDDIHHGLPKVVINENAQDCIKFADCVVNGPFSQRVARSLEDILRSGFRIHYV